MEHIWVAFLDPSDSYFLFADFVDFYTHWTYMLIFRRIFLSNYWWQKSDIWSQASCRYPYIVGNVFGPIRFLLPVCRFCWFLYTFNIHLYMHIFRRIILSNYWAEKNATKNEHICSMCIKINKVGKQEVGIWRVQKRYPQYGITI
jgi:hypothetical protein